LRNEQEFAGLWRINQRSHQMSIEVNKLAIDSLWVFVLPSWATFFSLDNSEMLLSVVSWRWEISWHSCVSRWTAEFALVKSASIFLLAFSKPNILPSI
jgi:hypothetical protein